MKLGFSISPFQFEELNTNSDWYRWLTDEINISIGKVNGELPDKNFYLSKYKLVHEIAEKTGAEIWRMGVSWGRIFKRRDEIDQNALSLYKEILKDLKDRGIEVIICLNHFDLPLWVHDPIIARDSMLTEGALGWYSENTVKEFLKFSKTVRDALGEYVDLWCTFNEPNVYLNFAYLSGIFPPGITSRKAYEKALLNLVTANNLVYEEFKGEKIGVVYNFPYVNDDEMEKVLIWDLLYKLKFDWIGVNYYSRIVFENKKVKRGYGMFCNPNSFSLEGNPTSDYGWEVYPNGLKEVLIKVSRRYEGKKIYITENGIADSRDYIRPYFILSHINAIKESRVNVEAYMYWSLVDNFEWNFGYEMKFGLYDINLKPRSSALLFKNLKNF
ncbi:family 1 glycosylhydrolase [Sulfolobaceae archaeon RB850M]|jgi:beta-galactosidase